MSGPSRDIIQQKIAGIFEAPESFESTALEVFRFQAEHNPLYSAFLTLLRRDPATISRLQDIPFLPISFFKTHEIKTLFWEPQTVFTSSGTTGQTTSRHLVRNPDQYLENTVRGFRHFYGDPADWIILALLPSYLERSGSSLVAMAEHFIQLSRHPQSGFFLHNLKNLHETLKNCPPGVPVLLLGVTYALLDFAETFPGAIPGVTIMETGGMKGKRQEITRTELHEILQKTLQPVAIHSEYGMTELFSQAYAQGGTRFSPTPLMQVITTEINDPFCACAPGRTGVLNIIDLANLDTCSFIATEDVGKVYADGRFEVNGRLDISELRGCNLMVE